MAGLTSQQAAERQRAVRNVALEQALADATGGKCYDLASAGRLPDEIRLQMLRATGLCEPGEALRPEAAEPARPAVMPWKDYRRQALEDVERRYLRDLLEASRGNVVRAAQASGLSPSRLYDLFRKYGLSTRP